MHATIHSSWSRRIGRAIQDIFKSRYGNGFCDQGKQSADMAFQFSRILLLQLAQQMIQK